MGIGSAPGWLWGPAPSGARDRPTPVQPGFPHPPAPPFPRAFSSPAGPAAQLFRHSLLGAFLPHALGAMETAGLTPTPCTAPQVHLPLPGDPAGKNPGALPR